MTENENNSHTDETTVDSEVAEDSTKAFDANLWSVFADIINIFVRDEAHAIKNQMMNYHQSVKLLDCKVHICITAMPMLNQVVDLIRPLNLFYQGTLNDVEETGEGSDVADTEVMDINRHESDEGVSKDMVWVVGAYTHLSSKDHKLLHLVTFQRLCNTNHDVLDAEQAYNILSW